jgi:ActR/RegA family two-component response regulator
MTDTEDTSSDVSPPVSMGALFVRSLLDRRGVARHRQATLVAEILGLGYTQAHRRLVSGAPWAIDDVARVAQHFGESLSNMVTSAAPVNTDHDPLSTGNDESGSVPAELVVDGLRWPCRIWVGERVEVGRTGTLVAMQGSTPAVAQWEVKPPAQLGKEADGANANLYAVRRLVIVPEQAQRYRVAVLDDDRDVADSLSEQFREAGLAAQAFYSPQELSAVLTVQPFDAYVVDWILGKDTALSMVAAIRSHDPKCPIAMLTGQLVSKRADENEVVTAMQTWRLMFYEKPVRAFIVAAALKQALTEAQAGANPKKG